MSEVIIEERRPLALSLLYILMDIIEGLILLRFVLKLLGANPYNAFINFIYSITHPLIAPFAGVFPIVAAGGSAIEWASVLALAIYGLIFLIIARIIRTLYSDI